MNNPSLIKREERISIFGLKPIKKRRSSTLLKKSVPHISNFPEGYTETSVPICNFCNINFKTLYKWHAHFTTFIHKEPIPSSQDPKTENKEYIIMCRFCGQDVVLKHANEHRCVIAEETRIDKLILNYNQTYMPIICVLCKNIKTFPSQAFLQIHILTSHSPTRDPLQCNICNAKFRTSDLVVHEDHAMDVHGSELNLIYWRLLAEKVTTKTKTDEIKYVCALSHFASKNSKTIVCCTESITDLFTLTLHTLCYHGYLQQKIIKYKKRESSKYKAISCKYCGEYFPSVEEFSNHILSVHSHGFMIRKDYIERRELLYKNVPFSHTCFTCSTILPTILDLQIHIMVNHATKEFGLCGICNKDLLHFNEGKNENKIEIIHWKSIKYHESLHYKQFIDFKENGIFNKSLKTIPKLYGSSQEFADDIESRKNVIPGPIFNDEKVKFFENLGQKNYETQISLELNDR